MISKRSIADSGSVKAVPGSSKAVYFSPKAARKRPGVVSERLAVLPKRPSAATLSKKDAPKPSPKPRPPLEVCNILCYFVGTFFPVMKTLFYGDNLKTV